MNERIKHLAASHFPRDCNGDILTTPESIMDFAEMIVRGCAELVASRPYIDDGNWPHPSTMIKDHFGVEK